MSVRKIFEEELQALKTELVKMCRLTESMIETAIRAIKERNPELGKSVVAMDKQVDEYEMDIEKKCMRILLKQQPVAKDFREVSTALKMIADIERFGDQASDIGEIIYTLGGAPYIKELTHIEQMGELACTMVRESVNSFIASDEKLADEVVALDDRMDELFLTVKNELIALIKADGANGDQAIELMMIAKYLERIGDHAVNVAEWTKYNETGVHVKY